MAVCSNVEENQGCLSTQDVEGADWLRESIESSIGFDLWPNKHKSLFRCCIRRRKRGGERETAEDCSPGHAWPLHWQTALYTRHIPLQIHLYTKTPCDLHDKTGSRAEIKLATVALHSWLRYRSAKMRVQCSYNTISFTSSFSLWQITILLHPWSVDEGKIFCCSPTGGEDMHIHSCLFDSSCF